MRKFHFVFAVAGALAIAPALAQVPALEQSTDPFEDQRPRDQDDFFEDAQIGPRGLRGGLEPDTGGRASGDRQTRRGARDGSQNAANPDLRELPDPFREAPDPLRDPLSAAELDAAQAPLPAPAAADANGRAEVSDADAYGALGVRLGSFLLFPELSVESLYDDNLFLSSTGQVGDWALVVIPSLRAQSDWSRHSLIATLNGVRSYHDRFSSEDDETFSAGLAGRIDIRRTTNLSAVVNYSQSLEDRSSSDFPSGAAGRAETRNRNFALEGNHSFNRVTVTLRGELSQEDFDDGVGGDGSVINNDDRDLTERRMTLRTSYEFQPDVSAFFEASVNQRDFAQAIDDDGTRNGSMGHDLQGGLLFQLTGKLTGEISAGYAFQAPDDVTLSDIDGLIFNAALEWQATGLTTLRFDASSQVDETTQAGSAGSIVRAAALSVEHSPRRNITLSASLGYEREEFSGSDVVDEDYELVLTGEYDLNRSAALTADYRYLESTSSTPGAEYSVNQFRLGVRVRR